MEGKDIIYLRHNGEAHMTHEGMIGLMTDTKFKMTETIIKSCFWCKGKKEIEQKIYVVPVIPQKILESDVGKFREFLDERIKGSTGTMKRVFKRIEERHEEIFSIY